MPAMSSLTLGAIGLFALTVLILWQRKADNFDLRWLLVDSTTEKVSLFKTGQLIALIVSTWGFVVLIQRDKMTEWYFTGYMASWAAANLLNKWLERGKQ